MSNNNTPPPIPNFQTMLDLTLLGQFFAQEINQVAENRRREYVRTALSRAFKRYEDHIGNYNFNARINIEEQTFEQLALAYTKILEQHAEQTAAGAKNMDGVYVDVVRDDDFHDLTRGQS